MQAKNGDKGLQDHHRSLQLPACVRSGGLAHLLRARGAKSAGRLAVRNKLHQAACVNRR